jgi:ABC-type multidrug transport system fused ATPase/permease subunit
LLRRLLPLKPYLSRYKKRYVAGFIALVLAQALRVNLPLIIKAAIDSLSRSVTWNGLLFYAGLLLLDIDRHLPGRGIRPAQ